MVLLRYGEGPLRYGIPREVIPPADPAPVGN